jgi:hypothetical protein
MRPLYAEKMNKKFTDGVFLPFWFRIGYGRRALTMKDVENH